VNKQDKKTELVENEVRFSFSAELSRFLDLESLLSGLFARREFDRLQHGFGIFCGVYWSNG